MAYTAFAGDATQGAGSHLDKMIPELWSDAIMRYFNKELVMRPFFDDYSSLVQGKGDVIHLPSIQEVAVGNKTANEGVTYSVNTETEIQISINKHKFSAKLFEDIALIQSNEQLFDKYAASMAYGLAKAVDSDIITELNSLGTTQALSADNTLSNADVETALGTLMANDIPKEECAFFVNPLMYADLLNSRSFVVGGGNVGGAGATGVGFGGDLSGNFPSLFGIPVFQTSLISSATGTGTHAGYLAHKSSVAVAVQQDIRMQSEYSVDYLGTKVVADVIYGVKVTTANQVKGIELLNP